MHSMHLYKYVVPARSDILRRLRIRFSPAVSLNDPFELHPIIDAICGEGEFEGMFTPTTTHVEDAMRRRYRQLSRNHRRRVTEEDFVSLVRRRPDVVDASFKEVMPALEAALRAQVPAIAARVRTALKQKLGILSLSESPVDLLMWGHYAARHSGMVLVFDTDDAFFNRPRQNDFYCLRQVSYELPTTTTLMGLNSDIYYRKGPAWAYEQEWRMIAPLSDRTECLVIDGEDIHLFSIPPTAIAGVIFGARASDSLRRAVQEDTANEPHLHHVVLSDAVLRADASGVDIVPVTSSQRMP
jgi:hypothetical protein